MLTHLLASKKWNAWINEWKQSSNCVEVLLMFLFCMCWCESTWMYSNTAKSSHSNQTVLLVRSGGGNLNYRNCKSSIKSGLRKSLMLPIWLKLYGRCIFSYVIIFTMLINRFEVSYKSRTRTWLQTLCQSNVLAAFLTGGSILNQADELDIKKRMKETRTNQLITRDK